MSWEAEEAGKAGSGSISIGEGEVISQKFRTKVKEENMILRKGWFVLVIDANFKLVAKT